MVSNTIDLIEWKLMFLILEDIKSNDSLRGWTILLNINYAQRQGELSVL